MILIGDGQKTEYTEKPYSTIGDIPQGVYRWKKVLLFKVMCGAFIIHESGGCVCWSNEEDWEEKMTCVSKGSPTITHLEIQS